jgi:ABC-type nickel/cobalt efflux system permease component RcnA
VLDFLTSSSLGPLLGVRHALEPDHLAAVSTLVSGEQRGGIKAALLGVWWGIGHTLALLVVGIVLLVLRAEMPSRAANAFELVVAMMLVGLGVRAVYQAWREGQTGPLRAHHHGRVVHAHHAGQPHIHIGTWTLARRPLIVGAVHGLAGSGALTALVLTTLPSLTAQLVYMGLFGLGSTLGMAVLSGVLGWPLARIGAHRGTARAIGFAIGAISIGLGVAWGYPLFAEVFF